MWPFKRGKASGKAVPEEVQQYYASEHRERVALAWLIAFISLILTIGVILGLFFGGRWAWHRIAHKQPTTAVKPLTPVAPAKPARPSQPAKPTPPTAKSNSKTKSSSGAKPNSSPSQGVVKAPAASSTPAPTPSSSTPSSPGSPVATGQGKITNTGPGQTIGLFVVVSLVGALGHSVYLRRRAV